MDSVASTLQPVLLLLAAGVFTVIACRSLSLPPLVGYLVTGVLVGPFSLAIIPDSEGIRHLAEVGVLFLMFSIGLEFSLARMRAMRRIVFGLGLAQVAITVAACTGATVMLGGGWQTGVALGGVAAMSSTAIVSKLLAERRELDAPHGREVMGVLLFQDLAVVPLLILIPALDRPGGELEVDLGGAILKAAVILVVLVAVGPRLMRGWLGLVARMKSNELFVLNVLFITLLTAFLTGLAGLSLALGAFVAGMLMAETEFRYQVEEDIKPFRDVLLGLFFVTVGMMLDLGLVLRELWMVLALFALMTAGKFVLVSGLSRVLGSSQGTALRTGLALAQGGEFGFVLLALAGPGLLNEEMRQSFLAAMVLSMLATPFIIAASSRIVLRLSQSEWMLRSLELHKVASTSIGTSGHVIILGYGRNGQRLARMLEAEGVHYVALDLDLERVREAAAAGETVVFADCVRREALQAAGIARASALVITFSDTAIAVRVLAHARGMNPSLPVIVRAREERDIARLTAAGASEVVPEAFESGVMLASHTLAWVGIPFNRVMRSMRKLREAQYDVLRGLFQGEEGDVESRAQPRLHTVTVTSGAYALGQKLDALELEQIGVEVRAVRRAGAARKLSAADAGTLREGDVIVLLGEPEPLAAAEMRLLGG